MTRSLLEHRRLAWRRATRSTLIHAAVGLLVLMSTACSMDGLVGKADLPSTLVDPADAKTPNGAFANYMMAVALLRDAVGWGDPAYVNMSGLLTDEGTIAVAKRGNSYVGLEIDIRIIPESEDGAPVGKTSNALYSALQQVRAQANQAQLLLRDYYPAPGNRPLMAHMLATKGYAELLLAEAYCSGIPLSTLDYDGDYTYQPGSTTEQVLQHALAQFDSAITLAGDSARILNLARVGKGRTLLQLGQVPEAAQAVADVPDTFRYGLTFSVAAKACGLWDCVNANTRYVNPVADREGDNGMPFLSEPDGRLPAIVSTAGSYLDAPDIPKEGYVIPLASGIEAQLIRVEAELDAGDPHWLVRLNALRTTCTDAALCASPAPAGIGGVAGLAPLSDPGTDDARLDLLFRERAYWMFFTGHRQGDLRRLVRNYGRDESTVYPTGWYDADFLYGNDVTLPIPYDERRLNPLFKGCIDRDA